MISITVTPSSKNSIGHIRSPLFPKTDCGPGERRQAICYGRETLVLTSAIGRWRASAQMMMPLQ